MVQVRGKFDGQRIQAESYNLLLPELTGDFGDLNTFILHEEQYIIDLLVLIYIDDNTYNEAIKLLRN